MPSQSLQSETVYYEVNDTAPDLEACLKDRDKNPVDLTGATVTINIAFVMPHSTYWRSPRDQIVTEGPCVVDPDQSEDGRRGWVTWTPEEGDLNPPGQFLYRFRVRWPDGRKQTFPAREYETLIITSPPGGVAYA